MPDYDKVIETLNHDEIRILIACSYGVPKSCVDLAIEHGEAKATITRHRPKWVSDFNERFKNGKVKL